MIELTVAGSNRSARVDDQFAHLVGYRWRLDKAGYVLRKAGGRRIYLHHVVLPGDRYPEFVRDHINRDKLDNQLANLRWVTQAENAQNRDPHRNNGTGYRGVMRIGKRYRATVTLNKVIHRLGMFDDPAEAGRAAAELRRTLLPCSAEAMAA